MCILASIDNMDSRVLVPIILEWVKGLKCTFAVKFDHFSEEKVSLRILIFTYCGNNICYKYNKVLAIH